MSVQAVNEIMWKGKDWKKKKKKKKGQLVMTN